jgi:hypothetical protein
MTHLRSLRRIGVVAALATAFWLGTTTATPTSLAGAGTTVPSVDVRTYGANGDGTHDDTRAIRRAMRAMAALGGTVRFPRGIYKVSAITVPDGVRLVGAGMAKSWIRGRVIAGSNVRLRDLKLGAKGHAFRVTAGAHDSTFLRCRFRGGGGSGGDSNTILLGNYANSCSDLTFRDCKIECTLGDYDNIRITENATDPAGAHVERITFEGCHIGVSNGVRRGSPRMDFEAYCDSQTGGTTYYHGYHDIAIIDCVFETSDWYNIDVTSPEAFRVRDASYHGSSGVTIRGCTLKGGKNYTICVESPTGTVIEGNTIWRGGSNTLKWGCGDMSTVDPGTIVRNNTFLLDVDNGFSLGSPAFYLRGGDNEVTGNTIRTSSAGMLFYLDQARDNVVSGNTIEAPAGATLFKQESNCSGNLLAPNTIVN